MNDESKPPVYVEAKSRGMRDGLIMVWANATTFSKIIGFTLLAFAGFSLWQDHNNDKDQQQVLRCQAEFIEDVTATIEKRGATTVENEAAVDAVILGVYEAMRGGDREALVQEFEDYRVTREEIKEQREANPYPVIAVSEECAP